MGGVNIVAGEKQPPGSRDARNPQDDRRDKPIKPLLAAQRQPTRSANPEFPCRTQALTSIFAAVNLLRLWKSNIAEVGFEHAK